MFTGVINQLGTILEAKQQGDLRLRIACDFDRIVIGESIACNGACLTVVAKADGWFEAELSAETIACTAPSWNKGDRLHLERALKLGDTLDGHMMTGHVDGIASIISITPSGDSHVLTFEAPEALAKFIAPKGSVALDGISLTVNQVEATRFTVNIIPHTWAVTTLGTHKVGDRVNLEIDLIARYVARLLKTA